MKFYKREGGEKLFISTKTITLGIFHTGSQDMGRYIWLAVAVANYLTAVKRKKVAIVELSGKNMLEEIAHHFNQGIGSGEYFELYGVRYYPYYKEKLQQKLLNENYNYIIFYGLRLFGNRNVDLSDYHRKLFVGSLKIGEAAEYESCLEKLFGEERTKEFFFMAEYFEYKEIRNLEKKIDISLLKLPTELNPFRIKRTEFVFFEAFL